MRSLIVILALALLTSLAGAENWPQWRGPNFNGATSESNLPASLDKEKNLLWALDMPGHGSSTPIVFDDRIFITSVDKKTDKLLAMCISRTDGKVLWQRECGMNFPKHGNNDMADPSAITDGKSAWFFFGTGDLWAFDIAGQPLWNRNIQADHGNFNIQFLYGASPLLYRGKLYIQVLRRERPYGPARYEIQSDSFLLAIDPATGKDIFKHVRTGPASGESKESYCTPIPYDGNDRREILLVGSDIASGHDPDTGKEFWRVDDWNRVRNANLRIVPSVVVADNLFIVCTPKVKGYVFAIRPGGSGDVSKTHVAWRTTDVTSDVPVPLFYQGNLYVLDGDFKKGLSRLDPKTGLRKWFTPLTSRRVFRASPTGADGKIYVMNEDAEVTILSAEDGQIVSKVSLGTEGSTRASITAAQGALFVRTGDKLYCFANR